MKPETLKQFIRQPYAWPGGYPCALLMRDIQNYREGLRDA